MSLATFSGLPDRHPGVEVSDAIVGGGGGADLVEVGGLLAVGLQQPGGNGGCRHCTPNKGIAL